MINYLEPSVVVVGLLFSERFVKPLNTPKYLRNGGAVIAEIT